MRPERALFFAVALLSLSLFSCAAERASAPPPRAVPSEQQSDDREIVPPAATPAEREARTQIREAGLEFTPAGFLASRLSPEAVGLFLRAGMPPDTPLPGKGETLLLDVLGSSAGSLEAQKVVGLLIEAGADVNQIGAGGSRPLLRAACCADLLEALLSAGARLDLTSPVAGETIGQTLMREAIASDRPEVVRLLIRRGYDVGGEGRRLVEEAGGRPEIATVIRVEGAARARAELARLDIPVEADELWSAIMEPDAEVVHLLLEAGLDPNLRREEVGDTPLLFAATMAPARGDAEEEAALAAIMLDLVDHGADVNAADATTDATPLLQAAQYCPPEIVRALIKAGARLKTAARGGATPLMMAVIFGRTETVRVLVEAGYDVAAERDGLLPLAAGKPEIEKLLKRKPGSTGR
jgi:ankyrin repeat protein